MSDVEVGKMVKVHLPGESPWAECLAVLPDGKWVGRIDNDLIATTPELNQAIAEKYNMAPLPILHGYKINDLVIFESRDYDDFKLWEPIAQQHSGGTA